MSNRKTISQLLEEYYVNKFIEDLNKSLFEEIDDIKD